MPSLDILQLQRIMETEEWQGAYHTFYESGTFLADTTLAMRNYFDNIVSVEINEPLYMRAITTIFNSGAQNIHHYLGDSSKIMADILEPFQHPIVFFLDGHWSGGITGRGEKDCPLLDELEIIARRKFADIVIIDDLHLFGTKVNEDWSGVTRKSVISAIGENRVLKVSETDGRLCVFLKGA
jgi:hypothetical protein